MILVCNVVAAQNEVAKHFFLDDFFVCVCQGPPRMSVRMKVVVQRDLEEGLVIIKGALAGGR